MSGLSNVVGSVGLTDGLYCDFHMFFVLLLVRDIELLFIVLKKKKNI